jgi:hypothetical protein
VTTPKGPQGQKRPADVIGNAVKVIRIATGEEEEELDRAKSRRAAPAVPAAALGHAHITSCPSPPACGGRGRDPARRQPQARGLDPRGREVRWVAPLLGTAGIPHLTPTLSAPRGGEGDISATCLAVRSVHALTSGVAQFGDGACGVGQEAGQQVRGCEGEGMNARSEFGFAGPSLMRGFSLPVRSL